VRSRRSPGLIAGHGGLVVERDPGRPTGRLMSQDGMEASYVDLADPTHLEFDYLRWIRVLLRAAKARRVLHIGGGACALARALAAEDRESRQEVCETDEEVLALAREHMGLRREPGLRVRGVEGRGWLERCPPGSFDAVVVDAYTGARVPRHLTTRQAAAALARAAPLAAVNVVDDRRGEQVRVVAAALREAYPTLLAFGVRPGNLVVAGLGAGLSIEPARLGPQLVADPAPAQLLGRAELVRLLEGAVALSDDPSDGGGSS
jgi:hypothetical protein